MIDKLRNNNFQSQVQYRYLFRFIEVISKTILLWVSVGSTFAQNLNPILLSELSSMNPGILFSISSGDNQFFWTGAAGINDLSKGDSLRCNQTFRIASVTKTYVAASILRLMEKRVLLLEDPISQHLSSNSLKILSKDYNLDQITIKQILTHSAGFFDHTNAPEFIQKVFDGSGYEWTRSAQFQIGIENGDPIGPPGAQFSYSDMGYVILGELIETYTGKSLDGGIKELLGIEKLGFNRTDFERIDAQTDQLRIHQYYKGKDTYHFNPTMDYYGGGGILSNSTELIYFFQALFQGKIFENASTLELMLQPVSYPSGAKVDYSMGIYKIQVNGLDAYGHSGFWGTQVVYIPKKDLYLAVNYSGGWAGGSQAPIFGKVLNEIEKCSQAK